jgi:molybdopterin-guanine dinucleotide biosynthesis protein B
MQTMRVIGLAGWSGAGKTTLMTRAIPVLAARGLRVSTIKHAHHGFDVDIPGKDSHVHRQAGASEVFVTSGQRWAHIHELRGEPELSLQDIFPRLNPVDLVIVEGFKREAHPTLEIYRTAVGKPLLHPDDDWIVALTSDGPVPDSRVPVIPLDDIEKIVDVLLVESIPIDRLNEAAQKIRSRKA